MQDQKGSEREVGNFHFKVLPYLTACMRRQVSSDKEFNILKKKRKKAVVLIKYLRFWKGSRFIAAPKIFPLKNWCF